jgi:hypothetical protein
MATAKKTTTSKASGVSSKAVTQKISPVVEAKTVKQAAPAPVAAPVKTAAPAPAKPAASAPVAAPVAPKAPVRTVSQGEWRSMVEQAAYYLAEKSGFSGNPEEHWAAAEAQVRSELNVKGIKIS